MRRVESVFTDQMTRETFKQRLALLSHCQESKIRALVEEYRRDLANVQSTALSDSLAGGIQSSRARSVIAQLDETAVEALGSIIAAQKLVPETFLLLAMVKGVIFAETAITGRLKAALFDIRIVPQPPEMQTLDEAEPPYRVCDEAYIALRRIRHPESYLQQLMEARHFLSLPDRDKNREIESLLQTHRFSRFLGDVEAEEEWICAAVHSEPRRLHAEHCRGSRLPVGDHLEPPKQCRAQATPR